MKILAKGRGVEVQATGTMTTNWDNCLKRQAPRVENGTRAAADVLMVASLELVPMETGALKASGKVRKKAGGLKSEFIVGYGSRLFTGAGFGRTKRPPFFYAVAVHQGYPSGKHRQPVKYLEIPYETKRNEMRAALHQQLG